MYSVFFISHRRALLLRQRHSEVLAASARTRASSLKPDLNLVAIRIGDVRVWEAWSKLAATEQPPAGALNFSNGAVDAFGSTSRKPKCATPPTTPAVLGSSVKVRMSRLPAACV